MEHSMTEALKLMVTGMSTVFVILITVVLLGNLIVIATNRFSKKTKSNSGSKNDSDISPDTVATIISAVEVVTGGKGNVTTINKI